MARKLLREKRVETALGNSNYQVREHERKTPSFITLGVQNENVNIKKVQYLCFSNFSKFEKGKIIF